MENSIDHLAERLNRSSGTDETAVVTEEEHEFPSYAARIWERETSSLPKPNLRFHDDQSIHDLIAVLGREPVETAGKPTESEQSSGSRENRLLMEIEGEEFLVSIEENYVFLSHPEWSVTGVGTDLLEAEKHLKLRVQRMFKDFLWKSASDMTIRALELRDFLFRIYGTK